MTYTRVSTRAAVTVPAPVSMTAEELLADESPYPRTELVRGQMLVREPPGHQHGDVLVRLVVTISAHLSAEQHTLGWSKPRGRLVAGDVGFTLQRNPDTVRAPDVAYIRDERWPKKPLPGYPEFPPDLAVEVRSPSERVGSVLARVSDLLTAGTLLVWIVDPRRRVAHVYRADGSVAVLSATESLSGEDLIPGLEIRLSALFDFGGEIVGGAGHVFGALAGKVSVTSAFFEPLPPDEFPKLEA